ncbi:phosphotransferase [Catenovulum agarivorans]|uniref:phosphotransferase n=1 Tax=Catenovulum agarivorans TaxID=1172192 RepID=UPI0002D68799|nr:phosphotransferase [Catenovulum agarivorans]
MLSIAQRLLIEQNFGSILNIEPINKGYSNQCFKLQVLDGSNQHQNLFVKSLNNKDAAHIQHEHQARSIAEQAQLTPKCLLQNTQHKLLVTEYVQTDTQACIEDIALLLVHTHSSDSQLVQIHQPNIIPQRLAADIQALASADKIDITLLELAKQLDSDCTNQVFCHGDISRDNILKTRDKTYLVDWEYARMASAEYDLAASICINQFNTAEQNQLVDEYQKHSQSSINQDLLLQYIQVFEYLNKLWFAKLA